MKNHRFNPFRTGLAAATLTFTLLAAGPAVAANIWDGGGFVDDWNAPNNWDDDVAPVANATLTFAGNTRNETNNNTLVNRQYNGFLFTNDGSAGNTNAFTLSGNAITLGGNITTTKNTAGATITDIIDLDMILNGNRTITTNHQNSSVQHNLIISGDISETATPRNLTKAGSGQLTLTGSNSFSGTLGIFGTLNANSIANVGTNSALGTGNTIRIGVSGGTGTLNMTAGAASTNRQIQIGSGSANTNTGGARINNNTTNGAGTLVFTNTANAEFNVLNGTAITGRTLTLGGANTDANEIQGIIADNNTVGGGTIGVTKEGAGRWILSNADNSYTGTTSVNGGTLIVNGNISTSSLTTVNTGGTLGGSGTVGSTSVIGGTFAPGNSIDSFNIIGDLTLGPDSFSNFEISAADNISDLAIVSAQLNFGGTLNVSNIAGVLAVGNTFNLFDFASKSGTFSSVNLPTLSSGLEWNQDNLYTTGVISVIPEPGAALLGGLGLLALLRRRR